MKYMKNWSSWSFLATIIKVKLQSFHMRSSPCGHAVDISSSLVMVGQPDSAALTGPCGARVVFPHSASPAWLQCLPLFCQKHVKNERRTSNGLKPVWPEFKTWHHQTGNHGNGVKQSTGPLELLDTLETNKELLYLKRCSLPLAKCMLGEAPAL